MTILYGIIICILIIAIISTLMITQKSDENYRSSSRKNNRNLSLIYVIVIALSVIALAIYIAFD